MLSPSTRYARRILPIVSTVIIPAGPLCKPEEASADARVGQLLDADLKLSRSTIPRRSTVSGPAAGQLDPDTLTRLLGASAYGIDYLDMPGHIPNGRSDRIFVSAREQDWGTRRPDASDGAQINGVSVIANFDPNTGAWADVGMTREEALASIYFERDEILRDVTPRQIAAVRQALDEEWGPMTIARMTGVRPEAVHLIREEMEEQRHPPISQPREPLPPLLAASRSGSHRVSAPVCRRCAHGSTLNFVGCCRGTL